jgi:quinoprotein relay system zinc metallohydrolase 2
VLILSCGTALADPAPFPVDEVAPGIFVRVGVDEDASPANDDAIANIGFIVGHDAVAVIDPGGSLNDGERLRATVRAKSKLPIRYVVMTHAHPDHVFGGVAFVPDHPVFVGNVHLPQQLTDRGGFYRETLARIIGAGRVGDFGIPTMLVTDQAEIDLGGRVLSLTAFGPAHSDADLVILDPETKTLWAGDLLFVRRIPALDGNLAGWQRTLARLTAIDAVRAVPGHGPASVPWPHGADAEITYFQVLDHDIRALQAKGADIETAVRTAGQSERGKWLLFDDYNGRNVTEVFKELEWE